VRVIEILALGHELRREAELACDSINASHLLVHEVMLQAFADDADDLLSSAALHGELSARLQRRLVERAIGHRVSL
jgi:hypothetical protein